MILYYNTNIELHHFRFMSAMTSYGRILTSVMNLEINPNSVQSWNIYLSGNPNKQSMCKSFEYFIFRLFTRTESALEQHY